MANQLNGICGVVKIVTASFGVLSSFYNRPAGGKYGYMEVILVVSL